MNPLTSRPSTRPTRFLPPVVTGCQTLCLYDAIGAAVVVDGPDGRRRLHVGRAWFARSWGRWVYVCPGPGPDQTSTTTVTVPSTIAALDARAAQAKGCWS